MAFWTGEVPIHLHSLINENYSFTSIELPKYPGSFAQRVEDSILGSGDIL